MDQSKPEILEIVDKEKAQASPSLGTTNYQNYVSQNNFKKSMKNPQSTDFRISTATQPMFYKTNQTFEKLNQQKQIAEG